MVEMHIEVRNNGHFHSSARHSSYVGIFCDGIVLPMIHWPNVCPTWYVALAILFCTWCETLSRIVESKSCPALAQDASTISPSRALQMSLDDDALDRSFQALGSLHSRSIPLSVPRTYVVRNGGFSSFPNHRAGCDHFISPKFSQNCLSNSPMND